MKVVGEGGRCARCLCPSGACCVEEEVHKQVKPSRSIEHTFVAEKLGDGVVQISKCRRLRISPNGRSQTDPNCLRLGSQDSILLAIFAARDLRGGRGRCALRRSHPCNDVCNTTPFPAESTRFLGGEHLFPLSHPSPPKEPHDFPTMLRSPTFPSLCRRLQYNPFPSDEHTISRWRAPLFTEPPLSSRGTTRLSDHGFPSL